MHRLEAISKIAKAMKENSSMTINQIVKATGLPKNMVKRYLKDLESGKVIHKTKGGVYEIN